MRIGIGQIGMGDGFSTNPADFGVPLNTTGVMVQTPSIDQTETALTAIARDQCMNTAGSIWDPSTNSCSGSGGSSTCPTGYVLNGFSCQPLPAQSTSSVCPAGSMCSIVPGVPNTSIYLGITAVVSLFFVAMAFGGHR